MSWNIVLDRNVYYDIAEMLDAVESNSASQLSSEYRGLLSTELLKRILYDRGYKLKDADAYSNAAVIVFRKDDLTVTVQLFYDRGLSRITVYHG